MNLPIKRPMLAAPSIDELTELTYPVMATPKLDGIRCLVMNGVAFSRKLKPIPNAYIQAMIGSILWEGADGELVIPGKSFNEIQSDVMSEDGEPDFQFIVFDVLPRYPTEPYVHRVVRSMPFQRLLRTRVLVPEYASSVEALSEIVKRHLAEGYEGTMVRSPDGPYKQNRATHREGYLTKIKPFEDDEGVVVGFVEEMENLNEATTNELGLTKRSSHAENKVGKGILGALVVRTDKWGEFNIGTGFDHATKTEIWANRVKYLGKHVKFKYQKYGTKDKPRIPVFCGFRDERDM